MTETNIKRIHSNLYFVSNLEKSAKFYTDLGFDIVRSDDTFRVKIGDFTLAFRDEKSVTIDKEAGMTPKGIGIFTYIEVADVDVQYAYIKKSDITPSGEPKDWPWGKREFAVKDPDGYKLVFYSPIK